MVSWAVLNAPVSETRAEPLAVRSLSSRVCLFCCDLKENVSLTLICLIFKRPSITRYMHCHLRLMDDWRNLLDRRKHGPSASGSPSAPRSDSGTGVAPAFRGQQPDRLS